MRASEHKEQQDASNRDIKATIVRMGRRVKVAVP